MRTHGALLWCRLADPQVAIPVVRRLLQRDAVRRAPIGRYRELTKNPSRRFPSSAVSKETFVALPVVRRILHRDANLKRRADAGLLAGAKLWGIEMVLDAGLPFGGCWGSVASCSLVGDTDRTVASTLFRPDRKGESRLRRGWS